MVLRNGCASAAVAGLMGCSGRGTSGVRGCKGSFKRALLRAPLRVRLRAGGLL